MYFFYQLKIYAENSNEEINALLNKVGLQNAAISMLKDV